MTEPVFDEPVSARAARTRLSEDPIVEMLTGVIGSHVFHLPGKHDQTEHGKGGPGKKAAPKKTPKKAPKKAPPGGDNGSASPGEVTAAKKLNDGQPLDTGVPEEKQLKRAIQDWSAGEENLVQLRGEMKDATTNPGAQTKGASLMRTVAASPANSPTLYRGMFDVDPGGIPESGGTIKMGASSFTRSKNVATTFSGKSQPNSHSVVMKVRPGSRSLPIDHTVLKEFRHEQEHISMGSFRVLSHTTRSGPSGRTIHDVEVEQVNV